MYTKTNHQYAKTRGNQTMYITVDEMLSLPALANAQLVAGKKGINRKIVSVNMMEVPNIAPYVKPDELIITTLYPIRENKSLQIELIHSLVKKGVSVLLIAPAFTDNQIPQFMIEQANQMDFPIVKLPVDAPFNEIINPILEEILDRQTSLLKKNASINKKFMDILINGGRLNEILELIHEEHHLPIAIFSPYLSPQVSIGDFVWPHFQDILLDINAGGCVLSLDERSDKFWAYTVMYSEVYYGTIVLCILEDEDIVNYHSETQMIEQASTLVALEIIRLKKEAESEYQYRSRLIDDLIHNRISSHSKIISLGKTYGWDLDSTFTPVLIQEQTTYQEYASHTVTPLNQMLLNFNQMKNAHIIAVELYTYTLLLFPEHYSPDQIRSMVEPYTHNTKQNPQLLISIGPKIENIMRLPFAYEQAKTCLNLAYKQKTLGNIITFDNIGVYRVLIDTHDPVQNSQSKKQYVQDKLGPILSLDKTKNTDLIKTLESYFATNRNIKKASVAMYIHHNTMRNRLDQIENLLNINLDESAICLEIQVALKLMTLL